MKKKIVLVLIFVAMILTLTGCYKMEPGELDKLSDLVKAEEKNFRKQAMLQYGKDAKVTSVKGQRLYHTNTLFPVVTVTAGGNLTGKIKGDKHGRFNAMYLVDENEIISDKNSEKINESLKELIETTGIEAFSVITKDSARKVHVVKDNIDTYEELLKDSKAVYTKAITMHDIRDLDLDYIFNVMNEQVREGNALLFEIVQINKFNEDKVESLTNRLDAGLSINDELRNFKKGEENKVKELNIEAFLYVSYDRYVKEGRMEYMNKNGEKVYRTTNGKEVIYDY